MNSLHSIPLLERSDRIAWYFFALWFTMATLGLALRAPWGILLSSYGIWFILINAALRLGILAVQFRSRGEISFFWRTCFLLLVLFGAVVVQWLLRQ